MDLMTSPSACSPAADMESRSEKEEQAGLVPSHGIFVQSNQTLAAHRPSPVRHVSTPAYDSPLRHHQRGHSTPHQVKESLNARSEYVTSQDDGSAQHRINQYIIKQEIGRGSFGAVHLAVDQYGTEYAVKEFSKSRLRKRAQSHILRSPRGRPKQGHIAATDEFNSPLHRNPNSDPTKGSSGGNAIGLIKEEIAIMKKLYHPNLCALIEVLDDPREDSLYMVMEMCKKGIIMKVGLDQKADPYSDESCRCWFRDLILGIEYLHAQGIVHRDIKPDNCLLTEHDVLKVVDFGVSEMFEKDSEMLTAKSAGSPAFLPPELCVVRHGDISGKSADIWSMGVTLYCLRYGRIPFEKSGIFELFEAIKTDEPSLEGETDDDFRDLICRILEKDATARIKMPELREHPWVTKYGNDPLLSETENTAEIVEPPTQAEMETAITGNVANLMTVMKAVNKFKKLIAHKRPPLMSSILSGEDSSRFSQPPIAIQRDSRTTPIQHKSHSVTAFDRRPVEGALVVEGVHREMDVLWGPDRASTDNDGDQKGKTDDIRLKTEPGAGARSKATSSRPLRCMDQNPDHSPEPKLSPVSTGGEEDEQYLAFRPEHSHSEYNRTRSFDEIGHRGHAHDPLQDHLYLYIGPSSYSAASGYADRRATFAPDGEDEETPIVSESPGAADIDIYETAYRDEIERIRRRSKEEGKDEDEPTVYLTRRVDARLGAVGQLAGRFVAKGGEGLDRFGSVTAWKDKRARVTDVSRALHTAARDEYDKRRQDRRRKDRVVAAKAEGSRPLAESTEAIKNQPDLRQHEASRAQSPDSAATHYGSSTFAQTAVAARAMEKGRQAKESMRSLMGMMKDTGSGSKEGNET